MSGRREINPSVFMWGHSRALSLSRHPVLSPPWCPHLLAPVCCPPTGFFQSLLPGSDDLASSLRVPRQQSDQSAAPTCLNLGHTDPIGPCHRKLAPPCWPTLGQIGHPTLPLSQFPQFSMGYQWHCAQLAGRASGILQQQ